MSKTNESSSTALAPLESNGFDLVPISEDVGEIIAEEMDGLGTIPFDTVKIPSGGGLSFELPGENDDNPIAATELVGIIIDHHPINAYWATEYDGSNNLPDCSSFDGKNGLDGTSGELRSCESCPYNQFGSDIKGGKGKACKNMHRLYIMVSGQPLPMLLVLPPTSLRNWKNYLGKKIVVRGKRPWMVLTKITLKKEKNENGIAYSQAVFTKTDDLSASEIAAIKPTATSIRALTRSAAMQSAATFAEGTEEPPTTEFTDIETDDALPFN